MKWDSSFLEDQNQPHCRPRAERLTGIRQSDRVYEEMKSTTTNTIVIPNVGTMPSSSVSGSNMNSSVNFPALPLANPFLPFLSLSLSVMSRLILSPEALNELALANASILFERFAQAGVQSQTIAWGDASAASAGRFSGGCGPIGSTNQSSSAVLTSIFFPLRRAVISRQAKRSTVLLLLNHEGPSRLQYLLFFDE